MSEERKLYRVELIFRESTIKDIKKYWELTGRIHNADEDGQAVFENVVGFEVKHGVIIIENVKDEYFTYNMSDFYRAKCIPVDSE